MSLLSRSRLGWKHYRYQTVRLTSSFKGTYKSENTMRASTWFLDKGCWINFCFILLTLNLLFGTFKVQTQYWVSQYQRT